MPELGLFKGDKGEAMRRDLDERIKKWRRKHPERPDCGWIRAARKALGMTTRQLAERLKVGQSAVIALERSEARETMQLGTLKRAARALNCELVYAFIPRHGSFEEELFQRRRFISGFGMATLQRERPKEMSQNDFRMLVNSLAWVQDARRVWGPDGMEEDIGEKTKEKFKLETEAATESETDRAEALREARALLDQMAKENFRMAVKTESHQEWGGEGSRG